MSRELQDLREHLVRFREVTLQAFASVNPAELGWRPGPNHYSLGQLFLHIAQAETSMSRANSMATGTWS